MGKAKSNKRLRRLARRASLKKGLPEHGFLAENNGEGKLTTAVLHLQSEKGMYKYFKKKHAK